MNKIGLLAFGVTTCVLVPTTLHVLQAGPNQVAKLVAPDMTSIQVGDAKVDVTIDNSLVAAGGKVHVTVTATADKHVKVPLALLVYEQAGMGEGRTEAPPDKIGRDEIMLDVKDGKASKTFAFTLPGNRSSGMDGMSQFGHYTVLVMAPKVADELESRRRHAKDSGDDPRQFFAAYEVARSGGNADDGSDGDDSDGAKLGKTGEIARLDVSTHTDSDHLRIIAPDTARADGDIAVKVRVTNPTKRAFSEVKVELATQPAELGGKDWTGLAPDSVEIADNPDATFALAAHETKDIVFHVKAGDTGTLGLFATLQCSGDDCYGKDGNDYRTVEQLNDSVLDAIDIMPAPEQPVEPATNTTAEAQPVKAPVVQVPVAQAPATPAKPATAPADPWAVALEPNTSATKPAQTAQVENKQ